MFMGNFNRQQVIKGIIALLKSQHFARQGDALAFGPEWEAVIVTRTGVEDHFTCGVSTVLQGLLAKLQLRPEPKYDAEENLDKVAITLDIMGTEYTAYVTSDAGRDQLEVEGPVIYRLEHACALQTAVFAIIERICDKHGFTLTHLGQHPYKAQCSEVDWVPHRQRYGAIRGFVGPKVHDTVITASNQVTVSAWSLEHQLQLVSIFGAFSGLIAALMGNTPFFGGQPSDILGRRALHWQHFPDKKRVGIPPLVNTVQEYARELADQIIFVEPCAVLGLRKLDQPMPFWKYARRLVHDPVKFREILNIHIACIWWESRLRLTKEGAVEGRTPCHQPIADAGCVEALYVGLAHNPEAAMQLVRRFTREQWSMLLVQGANEGLTRALFEGTPVVDLVSEMLVIARDGLMRRRLNEEEYLNPLWVRVAECRNPAQRILANGTSLEDALKQRAA